MSNDTKIAQITALSEAYKTFMTPQPGARGPDSYEVSELLAAAKRIAAAITGADVTDDIPF